MGDYINIGSYYTAIKGDTRSLGYRSAYEFEGPLASFCEPCTSAAIMRLKFTCIHEKITLNPKSLSRSLKT